MPRLKGMKVFVCDCGMQIVGFPGETKTCSYCKKRNVIPDKGVDVPNDAKTRNRPVIEKIV